MGVLLNATEGGYVVGGSSNAKGIAFTTDYETAVFKAEDSSLVMIGNQCRIYNDMPLPTYSYGKSETGDNDYNYRTDWTEEGRFVPTGSNKLITTGTDSKIYSGINSDDPRSASRFYVLGDESELVTDTVYFRADVPPVGSGEHVYTFPVYAVIDGWRSKVTGVNSNIHHNPVASRIVAVGEENEISNPGKDSVLAIFGKGSTVRNDTDQSTEYIFSGSEQGTVESFTEESVTSVLVANQARLINISGEAFVLAAKSPERFSVGQNSVIAVGWHDGLRQRISVLYEGQDIEAGKFYRVDENGQAIEVR